MSRFYMKIIHLLFLFSFLLTGGPQTSMAGEKTEFRVGYLPLLSQLPLVVSYENDRLSFKNIKVKFSRYNSYTAMEAAIRVGAIDFASLPIPVVLKMVTDGQAIKIVGACYTGGSILVTKEKGRIQVFEGVFVEEGGLENMRGKLIGVPGLDSNENLKLREVLGAVYIRPGLDYKTIGVSFTTIIKDLEAGKLDTIYLPEPFGTIAEEKKLAFPVEDQEGKLTGAPGTVCIVRSEILDKQKAGVREYLMSLMKSCQFISKDIEQAGAKQTAIIQEKYFHYPQNIVIKSLVQNKSSQNFNHFLPSREVINTYMDMAEQMKIITKPVDIDNILALDVMEQLNK